MIHVGTIKGVAWPYFTKLVLQLRKFIHKICINKVTQIFSVCGMFGFTGDFTI